MHRSHFVLHMWIAQFLWSDMNLDFTDVWSRFKVKFCPGLFGLRRVCASASFDMTLFSWNRSVFNVQIKLILFDKIHMVMMMSVHSRCIRSAEVNLSNHVCLIKTEKLPHKIVLSVLAHASPRKHPQSLILGAETCTFEHPWRRWTSLISWSHKDQRVRTLEVWM